MAPRNIPHQLRNSGNSENHYLLMFSPSGFEEFVMPASIPAPANAIPPSEPQLPDEDAAISIRRIHQLAVKFDILFG